MDPKLLNDVANQLSILADTLRTACSNTPAIEQPKEVSKAKISLEQVRSVLAEKSRQGFTTQVKALINLHGAERLSDIDPEHFPDMLKEAKEIGNV
ncbi:MAG: rRNA biogenesis protein rrp5 [Christensenellales bacterium]|jgi:hypothetical protein